MKKIILQNKDIINEFVKDWDKDNLHITQDINEAYNFSSVEHAEVMRLMAQDATGNRWRVQIIENEDNAGANEDGKQDHNVRHLDPVYRGYLALKQQYEAWTKSVYDYLHKVLDKQPGKRIECPVTSDGSRFRLQTEYSSDLVDEIYIDEVDVIVINTSSCDTLYVTKDKYYNCSFEELFSLCECLEHYINED